MKVVNPSRINHHNHPLVALSHQGKKSNDPIHNSKQLKKTDQELTKAQFSSVVEELLAEDDDDVTMDNCRSAEDTTVANNDTTTHHDSTKMDATISSTATSTFTTQHEDHPYNTLVVESGLSQSNTQKYSKSMTVLLTS